MNQINKDAIAESFSKAAHSYDQSAEFQRIAGNLLLDKLPLCSVTPKNILDLGCGTGFFTRKLSSLYPNSEVIGLDLSQGMIDFCQERSAKELYLCADAESIPLASNSQDLIYSNLTFQWLDSLDRLLSEINRVLKPNGVLIFSSLVPGTLHELKQSWMQVDNFKRVNNFLAFEQWQEAMLNQPFTQIDLNVKSLVIEYDTALGLMRDLKYIGAGNLDGARTKTLTSPSKVKKVECFYQDYRLDNGKLPATYELLIGSAVKRL